MFILIMCVSVGVCVGGCVCVNINMLRHVLVREEEKQVAPEEDRVHFGLLLSG